MDKLTKQYILQYINYDSVNGILTWNECAGRRKHHNLLDYKTDVITQKYHKRFIACSLKQVCWLLYYKKLAKCYLDYDDGNHNNLKIENIVQLKYVRKTRLSNRKNKNKLGYSNVVKRYNKYYATFHRNNRYFTSKSYDTPKEAYEAYLELLTNVDFK